MNRKKQYLPLRQAADLAGVPASTDTLARWARGGQLAAKKKGGTWTTRVTDVEHCGAAIDFLSRQWFAFEREIVRDHLESYGWRGLLTGRNIAVVAPRRQYPFPDNN